MGKWQAGDSLSWAEDRVERDPGFARATTSGESERAAASATTICDPSLEARLSGYACPVAYRAMVKKCLARKAVEKTQSGKVKHRLSHIAWKSRTARDSHFSHSFGCCCIHDEYLSNKRGHFYCAEIGDISNALRQARYVVLPGDYHTAILTYCAHFSRPGPRLTSQHFLPWISKFAFSRAMVRRPSHAHKSGGRAIVIVCTISMRYPRDRVCNGRPADNVQRNASH